MRSFAARATTFVEELSRGEWDHRRTEFDPAMVDAMPSIELRTLWERLESESGHFRRVEEVRVETKGHAHVVLVVCRFDRIRKVLRVVFDPGVALSGLWYGPVPEEIEAKTRSLVEAASRGSFELASQDFDDVMKRGLPPSKFAEAWKAVEKQAGAWQSVESVELLPEAEGWHSLAKARFERQRVVIDVAYDAQNRIAGLHFRPLLAEWSPPSYANPAAFEEREVKVGTGPALPGTLTLPRGAGPFAAVVLVHGSGPQDRDESVGGVKVFKDMAWGLASRGVAVLRYVKRTLHAPAGVVTQKEEVLDGAHDAIQLAGHTPGIDGKRIFLLGHSQGGYLAPRIAAANPSLAGLILLAGSSRPLEDSIVDQCAYLSSLEPDNPVLREQLEEARRFKQAVEDPLLRRDQDLQLFAGGLRAKGEYFLDVRGYEPGAVARTLSSKLLVLQGERDYQVTMKDFEGWKGALASRKGVTLKTYPTLNHLFVSGTGPSTPLEYERPGHVAEVVVDDISRWVLADAGGPP